MALERGFLLGDVGPSMLIHIVYLAVMGAIGLRVASRRLNLLLLP